MAISGLNQLGVGTTAHFIIPLPETEPIRICLYEEIQNKRKVIPSVYLAMSC